jgi:magnesium chelatase family protein
MKDFVDIRGQSKAIDGIVRAIRERANLLLVGPPGTGKTAMASRVTSLLPPLSDHERTWMLAEVVGLGYRDIDSAKLERAFRAPHYTISELALVGAPWRLHIPRAAACSCERMLPAHQYHNLPPALVGAAGELQLARFGVLFLDELTEFPLRIVRALGHAWRAMPSEIRPLLVGAANVCPCGWRGAAARTCVCSDASIACFQGITDAYAKSLGMTVAAEVVWQPQGSELPPGESSAQLRARINARTEERPKLHLHDPDDACEEVECPWATWKDK